MSHLFVMFFSAFFFFTLHFFVSVPVLSLKMMSISCRFSTHTEFFTWTECW